MCFVSKDPDNLFVNLKNQDILIFMIFGQNTTSYGWIDFFHLTRSRWPVILLVGSLVLLGGATLRSRTPVLHEAVALISLDEEDESSDANAGPMDFRHVGRNDLIRAAAELQGSALLSEVTGPLDLMARWEAADEVSLLDLLESRVRIDVRDEERSLIIAARDLSAEHAAALANAIADRFVGSTISLMGCEHLLPYSLIILLPTDCR